jgi:hypothetical protein
MLLAVAVGVGVGREYRAIRLLHPRWPVVVVLSSLWSFIFLGLHFGGVFEEGDEGRGAEGGGGEGGLPLSYLPITIAPLCAKEAGKRGRKGGRTGFRIRSKFNNSLS